MRHLVEILVRQKKAILNPEAVAVENGCRMLGYDVEKLDMGKYFCYISKKDNPDEARAEAEELCKNFLSNPIMQQFDIISIKEY